MKPLIKVFCLISGALIAAFWIPLSAYKDNFEVQISILSAVFILNALILPRKFVGFVFAVSMFVILFFIITGFFVQFGLGNANDFWKPLHFASSIMSARLFVGLISFKDLLGLPLPKTLRQIMLLYRSLYEHGSGGINRVGWYCARFAGKRRGLVSGLATLLGIHGWLHQQAKELALVIQNRMHWFEKGIGQ